MSELIEHWKPIAQLFQSVRAEYPAGWFVQRHGRTVEDLERDVTDALSAYPGGWPHVVLVGNRGSGKTFHLRRFLDRVASRGQWFPVFLDLERTFEVQSLKAGAIDGLQPWELVLLATASVHAALPHEHTNPSDHPTIARIEAAANALTDGRGVGRLDLGKVAAGIVGVAFQLATGAPTAGLATLVFSGETRWTVPLSGGPAVSADDPRARALLDASNDWLRRVSDRLGRQVVLVLDGVDRANADDENTTRRLLVADTALARLDCPVVCAAGPIWYRFNTSPEARAIWRTSELANITVASRTQPWVVEPDGVQFFRDLCLQRLPSETTLSDVVHDDALRLLAYYSGGVVREFLRMFHRSMQLALRADLKQVGQDQARAVVDEAGRDLDPGWTSNDTAVVEAIRARHNELPDLPGVERAVTRQLVRPYRNGEFWWGANPLLFRHRFKFDAGVSAP